MLIQPRRSRRWLLLALTLASALAGAQTLRPGASAPLPASVTTALAQAGVPLDAISVLVQDADGQAAPRLSHRADQAMNPASVMKLVTTYAALDLLGPGFTWRTPVWLDGQINRGVLKGNLVIQGQGDPKLVLERLWLLLHRVQSLGIRKIEGDIVLDRQAFAPLEGHPGDFDGEPLRPYNATPDALLINFKSVVLTLVPDPAHAVARVQLDPPLWGVQVPATVPLGNGKVCGDYRGALKADFSDPASIRLAGSYPASCGEKVWPVAYVDPASYTARTVQGLWHSMGGQLTGRVREGNAPATAATFESQSPTLAEVIRDINKFSNNVMARQLFLTLAAHRTGTGTGTGTGTSTSTGTGTGTGNGNGNGNGKATAAATQEAAREVLRQWWQQRISPALATLPSLPAPILDNGSGLSRQERISAEALARLLQVAWASPYMPELMSSLPIVGLDGTLKRSRATPAGAHLKTGSLNDVLALAGYVHGAGGKQVCLVAIINHANASDAKAALEALVDWAVGSASAH